MVRQAKEANPNNWYCLLKRIFNHDWGKKKNLVIEESSHLTDKEQVDAIASAFNAPSQRYQPLRKADIKLQDFNPDTLPVYTPNKINEYIDRIETKQSNTTWRYPCQSAERYLKSFCVPFADIVTTSIQTGQWPDRYKQEIITPVAKVSSTETLHRWDQFQTCLSVISTTGLQAIWKPKGAGHPTLLGTDAAENPHQCR